MKLISNSGRERALDELKSWPTEGSTIDVMSPSFSVHAFDAVADQLERAGKCRMILGHSDVVADGLFGGAEGLTMKGAQEARHKPFEAKAGLPGLDGEADDLSSSSLCFLAQRAKRIISRQLDDALRPSGLTGRQMIILEVIGWHGTLGQGALAEALGKDHTTLTANLGPLTSRGLVDRQIDGGDRRVRNISLTADGAMLLERARHALKTLDAELCARVGGNVDLATFLVALHGLAHLNLVSLGDGQGLSGKSDQTRTPVHGRNKEG